MIIGCGMSEYDRQNEKVVHHCHCQSLRRPALVARCLLLLHACREMVMSRALELSPSSLLSFGCVTSDTSQPSNQKWREIIALRNSWTLYGVSTPTSALDWERFDLRQINGKKSDTYGYNMDTDGPASIFCSLPSELQLHLQVAHTPYHTIR